MQTKKSKRPGRKSKDSVFFLGAALAIYVDEEGNQKQRHLNVLLENESNMLIKADLTSFNQAVMQRLNAENQVTPDRLKDIVFLSISPLGIMPPEDFYGIPAATKNLDGRPVGTA